MVAHINTDYDLINILDGADESDLAILADVITDNNKGRISLDSAIRNQIETFKRCGTLGRNFSPLIKEIQEFGGNSIINIFRGKGIFYREIVEDVAEHMKVDFKKGVSVEELELKILLTVAMKSMEKMSPEEQKQFLNKISGGKATGYGPAAFAAMHAAVLSGGLGSFFLARMIANATARQLLGRGLVTTPGPFAALPAFIGPIGWAISALWAAFDMASPAYRVTVPCVIQVAYMRQKKKDNDLPHCSNCGITLTLDQKFCSECGAKIG